MHERMNQGSAASSEASWDSYLAMLRASGGFCGGSSIGQGECLRRDGGTEQITSHLSDYIRIQAADIEDAKKFLHGNPVYESGSTIEIREFPPDE